MNATLAIDMLSRRAIVLRASGKPERIKAAEAHELACDAIRRTIPTEPIRIFAGAEDIFACPICNTAIPNKTRNFCNNPKCGQAFAWD